MSVEFNLRYSTEQNHQKIQKTVESIAEKHIESFNLDWKLNGEPFLTLSHDLIDAVAESIKQVVNIETRQETSGGTSDGRFIAKTGAQIVELGPVNKTIHQIKNFHKTIPKNRIFHKTMHQNTFLIKTIHQITIFHFCYLHITILLVNNLDFKIIHKIIHQCTSW